MHLRITKGGNLHNCVAAASDDLTSLVRKVITLHCLEKLQLTSNAHCN